MAVIWLELCKGNGAVKSVVYEHVHIHVCVCVCVCMRVREGRKARRRMYDTVLFLNEMSASVIQNSI
jgi:hypothetical protein